MFKLYKKADILEKISDKVKTVDDLFNLPLSEFDRECCDYWFNDYLDSKEYLDQGYFHVWSLELFRLLRGDRYGF